MRGLGIHEGLTVAIAWDSFMTNRPGPRERDRQRRPAST